MAEHSKTWAMNRYAHGSMSNVPWELASRLRTAFPSACTSSTSRRHLSAALDYREIASPAEPISIEIEKQIQQEFLALAERYRNERDPESAKRLGEELGKIVFSARSR